MSADLVTLNLSGGEAGRLVQSGQLTSVVTLNDEHGSGNDVLGALVFVNVFASPIPEVPTYSAMLMGLALLAAVQRRRRPRA